MGKGGGRGQKYQKMGDVTVIYGRPLFQDNLYFIHFIFFDTEYISNL